MKRGWPQYAATSDRERPRRGRPAWPRRRRHAAVAGAGTAIVSAVGMLTALLRRRSLPRGHGGCIVKCTTLVQFDASGNPSPYAKPSIASK